MRRTVKITQTCAIWLMVVGVCGVWAGGATIDEVLTAAKSRELTNAECGQLSQALADRSASGKWQAVAAALKSNWTRSGVSADGQLGLMTGIKGDLTAEDKAPMAAAMLDLYSATGPLLRELGPGQTGDLGGYLAYLGQAAQGGDLAGEWVKQSASGWKASANPDQVRQLLMTVKKGTSATAVQQRGVMASHIWASYLATDAPDRSDLSFPQLVNMVWVSSTELSGEQLSDLGGRVAGWYKDPSLAAIASLGNINVVMELPRGMGLSSHVPDMIATWMSASPKWQEVKGWGLVRLAVATVPGKSDLVVQQRPKLTGLFITTYFGPDAEELGLKQALAMSRKMLQVMTTEQREQVADKLLLRVSEATTPQLLVLLTATCTDAGRRGSAAVLAPLAGKILDMLESQPTSLSRGTLWTLSFAFATDERREQLRAKLTGADGNVNLSVATALSCAYRATRKDDVWRDWLAQLDEKTADPAITGDAKALWLTARSRALLMDATRPFGRVPRQTAMRSFQSLKQALAAGESQGIRRTVLVEMSEHYVMLQAPDVGIGMIESVKDQFSGEDRAKVDQLLINLEAAETALEQRRAVEKVTRVRLQRLARIRSYRRRLALAQDSDNQELIQKLEATILALESDG